MILKQIPEDFIVEEIPKISKSKLGSYFYYKLKKTNYNTEKIIQLLCKKHNLPRKYFSYAGNKDKIAITTQYISVKQEIPELKTEGFEIKKIGRGKNPISLGDLNGNRFIITVRDITKKPFEKSEFINYFGEQRFGKHNVEIGIAILKKDFKKASSLIDYFFVQEHLKQKPNDYVGAIQKVPFKILKIYIHAVQSYFWNKVAKQIVVDEIPLIAFDTDFENSEIEKAYDKILLEEKLLLRDFVIRQFHNLTPHGTIRKRITKVKDLKIGNLENDELNKKNKKIKVEFVLNKGSYATVFIKFLFSQI
ncbi:tRNA pseudouridine(13) synthase TruD [archaeon]|jgi:tRNA pseudouridine13 synthase|nr:tRNA pseudouridine(13) synthase TruD [archaeon]MBT4022673.1 tRNA pseudouridine(13) synthase TruD [archaeon]MBT4273133.1 tRNA pseudouridine(13) synthase TruD [archaeon]MBT4461114.1 tRNA pseudouridine(13) synthase TruD [archaeon]MBT4858783.1 tRNA pseudouridine(13) synthase TruD [archaeon]